MEWDVTEAGAVVGAKARGFSPGVLVRYSFHFQLFRKFGGLVGTDVGVFHNGITLPAATKSSCFGRGFSPGPGFSFPSMALGLVQNFSETQRVLVQGQYTGIIFPFMTTCLDNGNEQLLAAIPNSYALSGQWDVFGESGLAFSTVAGYRYLGSRCVGQQSVCRFGAEKTSALEKMDFSARGLFIQFGVTWPTGVVTEP
jgi:hypothetical protein